MLMLNILFNCFASSQSKICQILVIKKNHYTFWSCFRTFLPRWFDREAGPFPKIARCARAPWCPFQKDYFLQCKKS